MKRDPQPQPVSAYLPQVMMALDHAAVSNAGWSAYESAKRRWIDAHPEATPREYEAAMRRLADECGV